ncbi:MAG: hypothetical protein ACP5MZ_00195 [Candidatus Micrarchaeia archaeon]
MGQKGKRSKFLMLLILVIVIAIAAVFAYAYLQLTSLFHSLPPPTKVVTLIPNITAYISGSNLLYYDSGALLVPYFMLNYSTRNISDVYINATLYKQHPPVNIYLLSLPNECVGCSNDSIIVSNLTTYLEKYGVISSPAGINTVGLGSIGSMPNNSVLIVLSGLLPQQLLSPINSTSNYSQLDHLLNKGESIIYVGKNFGDIVGSGSIVLPNSYFPPYLTTYSTTYNASFAKLYRSRPMENLFFYNTTFDFATGNTYGGLTYVNYHNGSIIAFSNYPDSVSPKNLSEGIAKAIAEDFWVPRYATGYGSVRIASISNSGGSIGIALNNTGILASGDIINTLNSSFARIILYQNGSFMTHSNSIFYYLNYMPKYQLNGSMAMPDFVIPGQTIPTTMTVYTHSVKPVYLEPHISVYNNTGVEVQTMSVPFVSASGNFTFIKTMNVSFPPGQYVVSLQSASGADYASSYISVPPIKITSPVANFSGNSFVLSIKAASLPVSGVSYNITLDGKYPQSGVISNGAITYTLPKGTPEVFGTLNFSIRMLSQNFTYTLTNKPISITISGRDIDLMVVLIVVILLVTVVKAPARDEFYIDIPAMPKQNVVDIKLKARDVVSTFDKLNAYYRWRYMPLSKDEVKIAIANNIRNNGIPVSLTYSNIEVILDQLVNAGYIVSLDELYAPKDWLDKSSHDMQYLATFKKLRMWLVTHAFLFTDIDASTSADLTATINGEHVYVVIYSPTSKFKNLPVYAGSQTYLAFLNSEALMNFKDELAKSFSPEAEQLRIYISAGQVKLLDADNPDAYILT